MPSLADIPADLLTLDRKNDLITFLQTLPISDRDKKTILSDWGKYTGQHLSASDYDALLGPERTL